MQHPESSLSLLKGRSPFSALSLSRSQPAVRSESGSHLQNIEGGRGKTLGAGGVGAGAAAVSAGADRPPEKLLLHPIAPAAIGAGGGAPHPIAAEVHPAAVPREEGGVHRSPAAGSGAPNVQQVLLAHLWNRSVELSWTRSEEGVLLMVVMVIYGKSQLDISKGLPTAVLMRGVS